MAVAAAIVYHRTFGVPFLADDMSSIPENASIRKLSDLRSVFSPPVGKGLTVGSRPLLNFSFAINYSLTGLQLWGFHALNLLIHVSAALLLFGLIRRTLALDRARQAGNFPLTPPVPSSADEFFAFSAALVWLLHPLQTESVTYIVQRAESLVGALYLLTLYAFARAAEDPAAKRWYGVSIAACYLGMTAKEVMVSAPIVVFLYDGIFLSESFGEAWRARKGYYLTLASTWLILLALVLGAGGRGGSAGFGTEVSAWHYAITQCWAIVHYICLIIWPSPLVFDYGFGTMDGLGAVIPQAVVLLALLAATAFAVAKRSPLGFIGAVFFLVLAPSSSFVPVATQTIAEHRMYLPAAAVVLVLLIGAKTCVGRAGRVPLILAAIALGLAAMARNNVYRDDLTLFADTVAKRPHNARAHFLFGHALLSRGRTLEAVEAFRMTVKEQPDYIEAYHDLGSALVRAGKLPEALTAYEHTLRLRPIAKTHYAYASALAQLGRLGEAYAQYTKALELQPDFAECLNNRGSLLLQSGHVEQAVADYQAALRSAPDYFEAHVNLAVGLINLRRLPEAKAECEAAIRLKPNAAAGYWKLGDVLFESGQLEPAAASYSQAIAVDPAQFIAHFSLGRVLAQLGRLAEAGGHFERASQLRPEWAPPHDELAMVLAKLGQFPQALKEAERAVQLDPQSQDAAQHLRVIRERLESPH